MGARQSYLGLVDQGRRKPSRRNRNHGSKTKRTGSFSIIPEYVNAPLFNPPYSSLSTISEITERSSSKSRSRKSSSKSKTRRKQRGGAYINVYDIVKLSNSEDKPVSVDEINTILRLLLNRFNNIDIKDSSQVLIAMEKYGKFPNTSWNNLYDILTEIENR